MKKANIKIRLELISREASSIDTIHEVLALLPEPNYYELFGDTRILSDDRVLPKPNSKTLINFTHDYEEFDLHDCNEKYFAFWKSYSNNLSEISDNFGYELFLDYEISVHDLNYPSLIFRKEVINFISELNIELSFYFYND